MFGYVTMPRLKIDGLAIIAYLCLYSVGRFFLSYLRVNQILFLGLREAQRSPSSSVPAASRCCSSIPLWLPHCARADSWSRWKPTVRSPRPQASCG